MRRKRPRVVIVPADRVADHLASYRDGLRKDLTDRDVRGHVDSLLRYARRSRRERSEWLAYLFDGSPHHPEPFDLMGELADGATWTESQPSPPAASDWPDDPTDDGHSGSRIPRRPPDSSGSSPAEASLPDERAPHDIHQH